MKLSTGWQRCTRFASPATSLQKITTISSRITRPSSEKQKGWNRWLHPNQLELWSGHAAPCSAMAQQWQPLRHFRLLHTAMKLLRRTQWHKPVLTRI